jgi:hypothetical protein
VYTGGHRAFRRRARRQLSLVSQRVGRAWVLERARRPLLPRAGVAQVSGVSAF